MCILGIDKKELAHSHLLPAYLRVGVQCAIACFIKGCITVAQEREVLVTYQFRLQEGDMYVYVLTMCFQLLYIGTYHLGVYDIDKEVVAIQNDTSRWYGRQIICLDIIKGFLKKRMQALIASTVLNVC